MPPDAIGLFVGLLHDGDGVPAQDVGDALLELEVARIRGLVLH
jgi:hypothetical protein